MEPTFHSPYRHGYARVAAAVPRVALANPAVNVERTLELARRASEEGAAVVVFPELGLSGYAIGDLLHQRALLDAVRVGLAEVAWASAELTPLLWVGAPLDFEHRLFNCAVAIQGGRVLGVVPKSHLPNYREFYEQRHFQTSDLAPPEVELCGEAVPCGADLLFEASDVPGLSVHAEICEDLWVPVPPSASAALAGATVLCNLSASNATVAKADYRRTLCSSQSGRCLGAYVYAASGAGESTTDLAWDGHAMVWEDGSMLAESERFSDQPELIMADVDLERIAQERLRTNSFHEAARRQDLGWSGPRRVGFTLGEVPTAEGLMRPIRRFPFVPSGSSKRDERCAEVVHIQVAGLQQRLEATGIGKVVIGVSGGLDSTQALLIAVATMDRMGRSREDILAVTMPGFATSSRTLSDAHRLMSSLGVSASEIDIRPSCRQMLADLGHPAAEGEAVYDATYENVQAGERTSHLFRLANHHGGLVLGTGDLSELALGWTTYGVGDQMSHYNVNASVPKTLIRHLIAWQAGRADAETADVLSSILGTDISPELIPGATDDDQPAQRTEDTVGPYELQDFHLYYLTRFGFRPSKVAFLAHCAWGDASTGTWPANTPADERRSYDLAAIERWLRVFLQRFFANQFKRSAMPDGPKVGSGGSLSPRGDWRMPSDASAATWLAELDTSLPK